MLTISKMYNSLKKYEMDNYYLGENAPVYEFGGKMAERFGLKYISGGVFENVTSGKDASGAVLVRQGRAGYHNPGRDVVMSPDKSVAISCYLGRDNENRIKIMESHREAVKSVAGYIEKELILARINHGKNGIERVSTGLMLYAGFEHHTSRELDPQLHTHLVIFNSTSLPDGPPARCPAKAMENRNIYDCRKLLCRIYENQ
ncbi:MAG: MobF family relaxase, partial [Brevinematales bacterium]